MGWATLPLSVTFIPQKILQFDQQIQCKVFNSSFDPSCWTLKVSSLDSYLSHHNAFLSSSISNHSFFPYAAITTLVIIDHFWWWNTQNLVPPNNNFISQVCHPFWHWFLFVVVICVPVANSMRHSITARYSIPLFHDARWRLSPPNRSNICRSSIYRQFGIKKHQTYIQGQPSVLAPVPFVGAISFSCSFCSMKLWLYSIQNILIRHIFPCTIYFHRITFIFISVSLFSNLTSWIVLNWKSSEYISPSGIHFFLWSPPFDGVCRLYELICNETDKNKWFRYDSLTPVNAEHIHTTNSRRFHPCSITAPTIFVSLNPSTSWLPSI